MGHEVKLKCFYDFFVTSFWIVGEWCVEVFIIFRVRKFVLLSFYIRHEIDESKNAEVVGAV